jgi:hypothetical protein
VLLIQHDPLLEVETGEGRGGGGLWGLSLGPSLGAIHVNTPAGEDGTHVNIVVHE